MYSSMPWKAASVPTLSVLLTWTLKDTTETHFTCEVRQPVPSGSTVDHGRVLTYRNPTALRVSLGVSSSLVNASSTLDSHESYNMCKQVGEVYQIHKIIYTIIPWHMYYFTNIPIHRLINCYLCVIKYIVNLYIRSEWTKEASTRKRQVALGTGRRCWHNAPKVSLFIIQPLTR